MAPKWFFIIWGGAMRFNTSFAVCAAAAWIVGATTASAQVSYTLPVATASRMAAPTDMAQVIPMERTISPTDGASTRAAAPQA